MDMDEQSLIHSLHKNAKVKNIESDTTLKARNEYWEENIKKALEEDASVVFLTGASHLEGQYGIIEQLKSLGYDVVREQLSE